MAAQAPVPGDHPGPSTATAPPNSQPLPPPNPAITAPSPVKAETPASGSKEIPATATATAVAQPSKPPESPAAAAEAVHIPSYSRWFSWDTIHECELRLLPEFFDGKSPSRNPQVYRYYRDSIIKLYRQNPSRKITFTEARRTLVGDVGSVRKVFDFLETWGLINYLGSTSSKPLKWDDKEGSKSGSGAASQGGGSSGSNNVAEVPGSVKETAKRVCNGCKSVCTIACFASDKYDLTLCARCYVRGNYQVGVSSDFRRVEINEEMRLEWTEKEILHLLEGLMHYGDDWRKVAQHVGGRSEKECVAQFVKLPFGEEFLDPAEMERKRNAMENDLFVSAPDTSTPFPNKRMCLNPLADASNPIMAQAAFLAALAGVEVTKAAAEAAVAALSEVNYGVRRGSSADFPSHAKPQEAGVPSNGDSNLNVSEAALMEANSQLEKEEQDLEKAISEIAEVQMKRIHDKIIEFEELDLLMEKERQQLDQLKSMLFVDQLMLSIHKETGRKSVDAAEENAAFD